MSVSDDSTLTDHSAIVLDNAIAPTAFTNDTVFFFTGRSRNSLRGIWM